MASKVVKRAMRKFCSRHWQQHEIHKSRQKSRKVNLNNFACDLEACGNLPMFFPRNKVQPQLYTARQQKNLIKWEGTTLTTAAHVSHQRKLRIQRQLLSFGNWVNNSSGRLHWMKHKLWTCDWWFMANATFYTSIGLHVNFAKQVLFTSDQWQLVWQNELCTSSPKSEVSHGSIIRIGMPQETIFQILF